MSLDNGSPVEILGRPRDIGIPFHGLVQSGTLTLPSGATMPHPQPATGDVYIVRRPGWTAPERTPEQLAADAAADHQWRDYAIIAGRMRSALGSTSMQIGGNAVNGWIWFDPTGQAWRVHIANWGSYTDNSARVIQLNFGRLGRFGDPLDEVSRSTPPFSIEQAGGTEVEICPTAGGSYRVLEANDSVIYHKLLDITEAGDRTLFAAFVQHFHGARPSAYIERIVAIYELTIATDGSVSCATLKSRADCLGSQAWPEIYENPYKVTKFPLVFSETSTPLCVPGENYDLLIQEWGEVDAEYTYPPITRTNTHPVRAAGYVLTGGDSVAGYGAILPHTHARSLTGIVVGAYYVSGAATFLTASVEFDEAVDGGYSAALSSYTRRSKCTDGVLVTDPVPTLNFSSWATRVSTAVVSLQASGVTIFSDVTSSSVSSTSSVSADILTGSVEWEITRNGAVIDTGSQGYGPRSNWYEFTGETTGQHHLFMTPMYPLARVEYAWNTSDPPRHMDRLAADVFAGVGMYRVAPVGWNETTHGLVAQRLAGYALPAQHSFSDAVARGIVVASAQTYTPVSGLDVIAFPTGSYQPLTGQWAGGVSETPGALRCWV